MTAPVSDRVIVIGGGLAGVTTLYELAADGVPAVLLEADEELGRGASYANGGLLVPGLADPWNAPGVHKHLLAALFDPASSMRLRWRQLPGLAGWGVRFLLSSRRRVFERVTVAGYQLARYSVERSAELATSQALSFDALAAGCLKTFAHASEMHDPLAVCELLQPHGLRFELLDTAGVLAREPSLAAAAGRISGGIFYPDEASGDARSFTLELARRAEALGAQVRTGARVARVDVQGGRVRGVVLDGERLAGQVVLAAGIDSPALARPLGLSLPIVPAKGYSLTLDAEAFPGGGPRVPIMDHHLHVGVVPLGRRLRLVGTAEFAGRDTRIDPRRIELLRAVLQRLFPAAAAGVRWAEAAAWAGLRPLSPDGLPYIGAGPLPGLWVNSGHGSMGWSMASGSARLLVDLMQGRQPAIDPTPFAVTRRL